MFQTHCLGTKGRCSGAFAARGFESRDYGSRKQNKNEESNKQGALGIWVLSTGLFATLKRAF